MIDQKMIQYIAKLARIEIEENKLPLYAKQLNQIVEYIDTLNELDTTDVEAASHSMPVFNVFREDISLSLMQIESVFQNAPDSEGHFFRVPKILGD